MLFIINVLSSSRAIQDLKSILRYLSKVCGHSISPVVFVVADPRAAVHNPVHVSIAKVGASKTNVSLTFYYYNIFLFNNDKLVAKAQSKVQAQAKSKKKEKGNLASGLSLKSHGRNTPPPHPTDYF